MIWQNGESIPSGHVTLSDMAKYVQRERRIQLSEWVVVAIVRKVRG